MKREHCTYWGCREKATHYRSMPGGALLPVCSGHYEKPADTSARRLAAMENVVEHAREIREAERHLSMTLSDATLRATIYPTHT